MLTATESAFLQRAIELSRLGMQSGKGGPFGCVIVKDGEVISEGFNQVTSDNDPTAHAEIVAIRKACQQLKTHELLECEIYSSCEPCPMCLGAIYWARPARVIFANTKSDAADISFDDNHIYQEIGKSLADRKIPFLHYPHPLAKQVFQEWKELENKKQY